MTTATVAAAVILRDDHFHFDFLERQLVVNQIEQTKRALIRDLVATQFDFRGLSGELGMSGRHLAIEEERNVGVKFFLKLMQPLVGAIPSARLVHREKDLVCFFIEREKIDHRGVSHPGGFYFRRSFVLCHSMQSGFEEFVIRFLDFARNDKWASEGQGVLEAAYFFAKNSFEEMSSCKLRQ